MYLKSIEVQGFKSFANKMKFQFHNGITGIVGPNGSGKSNVADAVRWVLGEQSAKQLRGASMSDVIFSGTESRRPLGFASVALTLDNADHCLPADFEEVTVTRRLYRSGESEYLINGAACRLRDIQEMFYDTGIGKEGYSIIGQGQIDRILSGKPEERRELFDEAAGIVKFKRRKLAAQKKLEAENANLVRVNDILTEITRQIGPLEKQAEKAKLYLQKKENLKTLDINLFLLESGRIREQLAAVENKISISDQDLTDANRQLESAKSEYEAAERELSGINEKIEEKKTQINTAQLIRQQLTNQIELLQEQIRSVQQNEAHYQNRLTAIQADLCGKEEQRQKEKEQFDAVNEELSRADKAEKSSDSMLEGLSKEVSVLDQQIAEERAGLIALLNERSNTKARLQRYDTMTEQIQIRTAKLTGRILTARGEESRLEAAAQEQQAECRRIAGAIEEKLQENARIEQEIEKIRQKLQEKSRESEKNLESYHRDASRLETLQNITERYDGYGLSIRRVMEQKNAVKGIHGVVADLIRTQKKYETAIETALGASIQNIVTDNENTAKQLIDFLKKNRFGRATFLPLTAIRKRGGLAKEQALYEPGALGVASTLVDADGEYEVLVEYLLGQTLVADHIDSAIAIAKKYRHSIRIVTLDGELLSPGGSMSGGAFKNSGNLLGRRREMAELKKSIKELQETANGIHAKTEELRQLRANRRQDLALAAEKLQELYLQQNTAKLKLTEIEEQKTKAASGNEQLGGEAREMEEQLREIKKEQETIREELSASEQSEKEMEQRITDAQEKLEQKRQELERQNEKAAGLHARTAGLRQKAEFVQGNEKRIEKEIRLLEDEQGQIHQNQASFGNDIAEKEAQIKSTRESISLSVTDEEQVKKEMEVLQKQRLEVSGTHKDFFQKREELAALLSRLDKERFRLDNQKERLEDYQDRQISYMWEEYGLTASEAAAYQNEAHQDAGQIKKQVAALKNEIRALGPVNVNAIEEYKETSKRHTFLSGQYEDLVKAGEALKSVITDLDAGMRRQFAKQFAVMQQEFEKSFRELFGGGHGALELVEDGDMLEAGVRIVAQPPGKKLQNMMQMSGGEKALTAIALLFAIQNMKPSPFCLLDEIEAALDENNVSRYAQYLKKLAKNTQFIIITHRRGTMAAADRLYGITMQEKGISTQVSVNMVESELDK